MKIFNSMLAIILLFSTHLLWAEEYCERVFDYTDKYAPPKGWHITYLKNEEKGGDIRLYFYIAEYNYDHKNKENGNRASCFFKNGSNTISLEITTDADNLPSPLGTGRWDRLDAKSLYCFPTMLTNPRDCPLP